MDKKDAFIRVGSTYYKWVEQPLLDGSVVKKYIPWTLEALRQDYGKKFIADIPRYDGFCTVPSHTNYQKEVGSFLNLYQPLRHGETWEEHCTTTLGLINHIFDEQYDLGMDYLQLLYNEPTQKLPILLLVSTERNTGKTTFLNFLKLLFQDNATFNTNEDFRSQFNADWAGKLLIMVDEVLLSRREDSERLKNLSTARTYKVEAKGKDRSEVEFFAKFVLCSNNETFPLVIDPEETRYWVRKVPPLINDDPYILSTIKYEMPAFIRRLRNRKLSTCCESRMWFNPKLIHTEALDNIIRHNRPRAELDMVELCLDVMERHNLTRFSFCPNDIHTLLMNTHVKIEKWQILKVLKERWKLKPADNAYRYTTYNIDYNDASNYMAVQRTGRYYTVQRDFLEQLRC